MSDWTTLGQLPPGTLFEDELGRKGVKTDWGHDQANLARGWIEIGSGVQRYALQEKPVRPLPPPGEAPSPLTEEERAGAKEELAVIMAQARGDADMSPSEAGEMVNRLLWLLGLTPDERGLVRALAERPTDATAIAALSDLLKEKGCEADGAAMAEGWRENLIGLVRDYGIYASIADGETATAGPDGWADHGRRAALDHLSRIRKLVGLPEDTA